MQLYGGDLDGITEHLDHVAAVGADVLYTTPVFPGESNHRYNATTFTEVDELLGGSEAYARLSAAVHERGWRILGDLTTNHTGDTHEWFLSAVDDAARPAPLVLLLRRRRHLRRLDGPRHAAQDQPRQPRRPPRDGRRTRLRGRSLAPTALRRRRVAHRRRQHDRPARRHRRGPRGRPHRAGHGGRAARRPVGHRRAQPRRDRRRRRRRLARHDELLGLLVAGVVVAARSRVAGTPVRPTGAGPASRGRRGRRDLPGLAGCARLARHRVELEHPRLPRLRPHPHPRGRGRRRPPRRRRPAVHDARRPDDLRRGRDRARGRQRRGRPPPDAVAPPRGVGRADAHDVRRPGAAAAGARGPAPWRAALGPRRRRHHRLPPRAPRPDRPRRRPPRCGQRVHAPRRGRPAPLRVRAGRRRPRPAGRTVSRSRRPTGSRLDVWEITD